MKVLMTGAAGVLGRLLTALLENAGGYELRLTDVCDLDTSHEYIRADLADPQQVRGLCDGIDQVLHIAAIHPWKQYSQQQYLDCNIKGTHNIVQEAAAAKVDRLIYTSSVAAMGYQSGPDAPLPFDESKPCRPVESLYNLSKLVGEQFCAMYHHTAGLDYLALRPGTFIPREEDDPQFGLALLAVAVHRQDVAAAHLLALQSDLVNEALIITAGIPFTRDDGPALPADAPSVIRKHFPDVARLEAQGIELPQRITMCYSIDRARRLLGYQPQVTFETWLRRKLAQADSGGER